MVTDVVLSDKDLVEIPCRCKKCRYKELINKTINRRYPKYKSLELVTFELVEVKDDERM